MFLDISPSPLPLFPFSLSLSLGLFFFLTLSPFPSLPPYFPLSSKKLNAVQTDKQWTCKKLDKFCLSFLPLRIMTNLSFFNTFSLLHSQLPFFVFICLHLKQEEKNCLKCLVVVVVMAAESEVNFCISYLPFPGTLLKFW